MLTWRASTGPPRLSCSISSLVAWISGTSSWLDFSTKNIHRLKNYHAWKTLEAKSKISYHKKNLTVSNQVFGRFKPSWSEVGTYTFPFDFIIYSLRCCDLLDQLTYAKQQPYWFFFKEKKHFSHPFPRKEPIDSFSPKNREEVGFASSKIFNDPSWTVEVHFYKWMRSTWFSDSLIILIACFILFCWVSNFTQKPHCLLKWSLLLVSVKR